MFRLNEANRNNAFDVRWRSDLERYIACLDEWTTYSNDVFPEAKDRLVAVLDANVELKQFIDRHSSLLQEAVSCKTGWKLLIKMIQNLFSHYSAWKDVLESALQFEAKLNAFSPSVDSNTNRQLLRIAELNSQYQALDSSSGEGALHHSACQNQDCQLRLSLLEQLKRLQGELIEFIGGNEVKAAASRRLQSKWEDIHKSFPYPDWLDPRCGLFEVVLPAFPHCPNSDFFPGDPTTGHQFCDLRQRIHEAQLLLFPPPRPAKPASQYTDDLDSLLAELALPLQRDARNNNQAEDDIDELLASLVPVRPQNTAIDDLLADLL